MPVKTTSSAPGDHTAREILSQPDVWRETSCRLADGGTLERLASAFSADRPWLFVGCGSSHYLAQLVAAQWAGRLRMVASAVTASDLLFSPEEILWRTGAEQAVLISRSGETTEVLRAAELLGPRLSSRTLSVTCKAGTPIEARCAHGLTLSWAAEESMVATRSFTATLVALQRLGLTLAEDAEMAAALNRLPDRGAAFLEANAGRIQRFAEERSFTHHVFLGQGLHHWIAQEAAMKVMEMSSSQAQAYHTLEYRHGPRALAGPGTLVTLIASEASLEEELRVLAEMKALGATTCLVTAGATAASREIADLMIELGEPDVAGYALRAIPAQLLGLGIGRRKGLNPDAPHNLTRAVVLDR